MTDQERREWGKAYRKTPKGVLSHCHSKMRYRSKIRKMEKMDFDLKYFHERFIDDDVFNGLFKNWENSGHEFLLKPSVDRIDPDKGYTKENIQFLTWGENLRKGTIENAERITTPVIMCDLTGKELKEFKSVKEAGEQTGIRAAYISKNCQGLSRTTGGFIFKYRGDKFKFLKYRKSDSGDDCKAPKRKPEIKIEVGQTWVKGNRERTVVYFDETHAKYQTKSDKRYGTTTEIYWNLFYGWVIDGATLKNKNIMSPGQTWIKGKREKTIIRFDEHTLWCVAEGKVTEVYRNAFKNWLHGAKLKEEKA